MHTPFCAFHSLRDASNLSIRSFNIYLTTGTFSGVAFLFFIHSIFALCFAVGTHLNSLTLTPHSRAHVGYRTKLMQVLCWLFHAGIMGRNIPIGHGGDMCAPSCRAPRHRLSHALRLGT